MKFAHRSPTERTRRTKVPQRWQQQSSRKSIHASRYSFGVPFHRVQTWMWLRVSRGNVTVTSPDEELPVNGITPSKRADAPFSGVTATAMGTSLVKLRAWTRTVWFVEALAGR